MNRPSYCLTALTVAILVAGCGQKTDLEPVPPADLPPAPYGATARPQSEDLLQLDTLAAPERSVELRRRSEEREDDPFDLPPE